MTIDEMISIQKEFDNNHRSNFEWGEKINESNITVAEHLLVAYFGEVGEFANIIKKISRGDFTLKEAYPLLQDELADMFIYLLKLSYQFNIDIETAFVTKINKNKIKFKNYEKRNDRNTD